MATPRNTTYELIHHLGRGNVPRTEIPQVLSTIFDARDYKHSIQQLPEQDLGMWVERLDQVYLSRFSLEWLDSLPFPDHRFRDLPGGTSEKNSALPEKDLWIKKDST